MRGLSIKPQVIVIFGWLLSTSAFADSAFPIRDFTAEYAIRVSGIIVGKISRSFKKSPDNRYIFESTANATGIVGLFSSNLTSERSEGSYLVSRLLPDLYEQKRIKGKKTKSMRIELDYAAELIKVTHRGRYTERILSAQVDDKISFQIQLMVDLLNGRREFNYMIEGGSKTKPYYAAIKAKEIIEVPYGKLSAHRIEEIGDPSEQSIFWCAETLQYLPVRVVLKDEGDETEILLTKFSASSI